MAGKKMLLVNPRKRRKRRTTGTKRRRRNPSTARRRTTPARRRSTRSVKRSAPKRRRRRNPAPRGVMRFVQPAVTGAGSAVGLDILWGYLPVPDMMQTGMMRHASKAALALGVGMFLPNTGFVKRATAERMAQGALTVYAADALREGVQTFLPDVPLGYYSPAYVPPGGAGVGEYLSEYVSGGTVHDPMGYSSMPGYQPGVGEYVEAEDTSHYG